MKKLLLSSILVLAVISIAGCSAKGGCGAKPCQQTNVNL